MYSPTWTYNYINSGSNIGTVTDDAYDVLNRQGAMTLADMPYNGTLTGYSYEWSNNIVKMTKALEYRATDESYYANDSSSLSEVKQKLADGHVGVVSTYAGGWVVKRNSNGQYAVVCSADGGGHDVAVVGYDDDFQITVNGQILTGAFKLANSWGTNTIEHNSGYIWVMYDALNMSSQYDTDWENGLTTRSDESYSSDMREQVFKSAGQFHFIEAHKCNVTFAGCVQFTTQNPYNTVVYASEGSSAPTNLSYRRCNGYKMDYISGDTVNPIFVFDYFSLNSDGTYDGDLYNMDSCVSSEWTVRLREYGTETTDCFTARVIDNFGNLIAPVNPWSTSMVDCNTSTTIPVNLAKGRVTAYDTAAITSADSQLVLDFLTLSAELSNVQLYLADYNSDGKVSMSDVVAMNSDIAARNGETYAITDYIDEWGCSLADVIEEQYDMPIEQYVAQNYAELSALNAIPADMNVSSY